MFLSQVKNFERTQFWRYLVGSLIVILASSIGQVLLFFGWWFKLDTLDSMKTMTHTELMHILDPNTTLVLIMTTFLFALIALYFVVTKYHKQPFKTLITSRNKVDWKRIFFSFSVYSFYVLFAVYVSYQNTPENYIWNFDLLPFLGLFLIGIVMFPIQIGVEELVFRGYLMQAFAKLGSSRLFALVMTTLVFAGLHVTNPEVGKIGYIAMFYYVLSALFLGILTLLDEGLELALGFHFANNFMTALLVTSEWTALQTNSVLKDISEEPDMGVYMLLPTLIVYPILLLIFAKKYKWNDWKGRIFGKL